MTSATSGISRAASAAAAIATKSSTTSAAPPMSPPSMSGWASSSAAFAGFIEPPYWIRTRLGRLVAEQVGEHAADVRVRGLRDLGRGRQAGADRPHRLVGEGEPGQLDGADVRERAGELDR